MTDDERASAVEMLLNNIKTIIGDNTDVSVTVERGLTHTQFRIEHNNTATVTIKINGGATHRTYAFALDVKE